MKTKKSMEWKEIKDIGLTVAALVTAGVTAILGIFKALGWVKFGKKEKADVADVEAHTDVSKAAVVSTITAASTSLLIQMGVLLKRADIADIKKQEDIDRLRAEVYKLNEALALCKRNVSSLLDKIEDLEKEIGK